MRTSTASPNIVLIVADNLGWGELGCYGGGALRGAPTPNIDALAGQGLLLQNFNVESDCVPTRSALMSGRHPIRTGCIQSVPMGLPQGLTRREITLAQILSAQGYATAHYGKWHLGDIPGRFPSDRGFDAWYGIPRTTDESQFTAAIGFDPAVLDLPWIMRGRSGEPSENVKVYDLDSRRQIDAELVDESIAFMQRNARAGRPFFLYLPLVHLHFPTLPHPDFAGRTGAGDFADSMVELDHRVGQVVRALDELDGAGNTLLIFCSDNGPEFRIPYRGTAGPWSGTYHTAMEGSLRVPCIARWPGQIPGGRVSNEIVHVTDLFTTLAGVAGASVPQDRPIDGVDQLPLLLGRQQKSAREGFPFYIRNELRAVKWRDWKLHFHWEPEVNESKGRLESPYLFNITRDPKEQMDVMASNTWVRGPVLKLVKAFQDSFLQYPNTPPGQPD
ncbi:arylsulfatase [Verminephrobacter aporrectodeae]|uniref:Arylsulfatase n=1 Tax=Verminephrobacter aporrectodeae subsp. tuberculatae TaxID=1110392 RepID=A0ABT3KTK6_9BURK|nr:arylsulfatase [Verminephrobacter aporrectodeae]MCW5222631.1 arylsulfatase [Verminephrobacter aporrectodeae subsp. tuberculatae]MCW5257138.1 arylsulfatase [Verminephrobacter aporrectodeae subsp. tuberculatae]MCW5321662.1 arylsulfatase [Verminephrobacter aporrectodeae subsp. tuberculatae]MCW8164280.1 arylsulfatase [Verminephrobacter aporrectodeae subsp. tuberculatae]MCW8171438.1 arylsulfatase [Verminephrobacter aporrectodeae subsp. tuberculatae]